MIYYLRLKPPFLPLHFEKHHCVETCGRVLRPPCHGDGIWGSGKNQSSQQGRGPGCLQVPQGLGPHPARSHLTLSLELANIGDF